MMNAILIAVISLGVIALILGAILYVASKKFAVYEDPRIAQVAAVLPQANCGGCGYPGCNGSGRWPACDGPGRCYSGTEGRGE